ncbi:MAG TPA: SapC family protein [Gallionella sp.]|nr:SapC family protein [Gallionella sp.]
MTTPYIPYSDVIALDRDLHRELAFPATPLDFRFAAALNIVPLLAQELPLAAAHYPIVFVPGASEPLLAALVGLGDGRNCYVDAEGRWLDGAYIPAWIRRYPFVTERREGSETLVGIDKAFGWASKSEGAALFADDGATTERLQAALNYCAEFETAAAATRAFTAAVRDAGLLQDSNMRIERPGAEPHQITGFAVVREFDLAALRDTTVLDFHRKGYLGLLHAHLMSLGSTRQLASVNAGEQTVH